MIIVAYDEVHYDQSMVFYLYKNFFFAVKLDHSLTWNYKVGQKSLYKYRESYF